MGIRKLNKLDRGMTVAQVRSLLGEPQQKELKAGKTILKYSLFQLFHGWKPAYLVFDDQALLSEWYVNEAEYQAQQRAWIDAFKSMNR